MVISLSPELYVFYMLIQENVLLGLKERGLAPLKHVSSH